MVWFQFAPKGSNWVSAWREGLAHAPALNSSARAMGILKRAAKRSRFLRKASPTAPSKVRSDAPLFVRPAGSEGVATDAETNAGEGSSSAAAIRARPAKANAETAMMMVCLTLNVLPPAF